MALDIHMLPPSTHHPPIITHGLLSSIDSRADPIECLDAVHQSILLHSWTILRPCSLAPKTIRGEPTWQVIGLTKLHESTLCVYIYNYILLYYIIVLSYIKYIYIYICIYLFNYISIYTHEYQRILHQYLWNVDSHPYLGLSMSDPVLHGARFQHQLMDVLLCQTDLLEDLFEIPLFQHTHSRKEAAQGGPVGWRHGATGNGFGMGTGSRWWFFGGKKELYSIYSIHVMGCQPLLWCYMEEELHLVLTLYLLWLWDVYMF